MLEDGPYFDAWAMACPEASLWAHHTHTCGSARQRTDTRAQHGAGPWQRGRHTAARARAATQAAQHTQRRLLVRSPMRCFRLLPGQVMGKHTDYAGGRSLLAAISKAFCVVTTDRDVRPRPHTHAHAHTHTRTPYHTRTHTHTRTHHTHIHTHQTDMRPVPPTHTHTPTHPHPPPLVISSAHGGAANWEIFLLLSCAGRDRREVIRANVSGYSPCWSR